MEAQTRAEDGMDLLRVETFQAPAASGLPSEAELTSKIDKMAADLSALRKAPVAEPYDGPAVLSGRAAAVFFHEVLGHRLEGHRQRDEEEGQTFTKKIGQEVAAEIPERDRRPGLCHEIGRVKLAGAYDFDNEGEPSQRVEVIKRRGAEEFSDVADAHQRFRPIEWPWAKPARADAHGTPRNLIVTSTKNGARTACLLLTYQSASASFPLGHRFCRCNDQVPLASRGHPPGLVSPMAIRLAEIFDGHPRHQKILQHPVFDHFYSLRRFALVVKVIRAGQLDSSNLVHSRVVDHAQEFRQHFLADFLRECLSFFFIALPVAFQSVAQHFMEKDRRRAPAQYRRSIVRLRHRRLRNALKSAAILSILLVSSASLGKPLAAGAWNVSTRSKSMPSSARVCASMIIRLEALGDTMALPSLDTILEFERWI